MPKAPNLDTRRKFVGIVELSLLILISMTASWAGAIPMPNPDQLAASEDSVLLCSGVIVAPGRQAVYAMAPSGEVEAIDLSMGGLSWRSEAASKPLALHGHLLVALAEAEQPDGDSQVVILDVERRGQPATEVSLPMPASAWRQIDEGLGASLRIESVAMGGQISVHWESARQRIHGAAALVAKGRRTKGVGSLEIERGRGGLRLDLASGVVVPLGQSIEAPPLAAPRTRILEGEERLEGLQDTGLQFLSADARHVLTSTRIADEREWDRYRWRIHERASGRFIGMVLAHRSRADFVVSSSTLLYVALPALRRVHEERWDEAPLALRAVDLLSGTELWARPIRDTRYYGPFPP